MMLPGANTGLPRMPSPYDPEMTEIMQQESMLERESFEIASLLQRAKNDQERTEAREKLKKVVVKHFDIRQKRRELELARLEKEIEKIKQEVQRRKDRKDALIEARIGQLIGDDSGF